MTFTVSPWWVVADLWLVLFGAWFTGRAAWRVVRAAAGWAGDWLRGRVDPPWWWKPWLYRRGEDYEDEESLEELPPERSWEELTEEIEAENESYFRRARSAPFAPERERRAPPWEAFQRVQYEAMGFEYPSGLMARVRELTP